jgi:hypothetical protein
MASDRSATWSLAKMAVARGAGGSIALLRMRNDDFDLPATGPH